MEELEQNNDKNDKKNNKTSFELYEISKVWDELKDFKDKIADKLLEMREEIRSLKASLNRQGGKLGGYTVKELMVLKQLGINPKDLLSGNNSIDNGEKTQKEGNGYNL